MNKSKTIHIISKTNLCVDLLNMGDESDSERRKNALSYLETSHMYREAFVKKTMDNFSEKITKTELSNALRENFFRSYDLRMALADKKQQRIMQKSSASSLHDDALSPADVRR